MILFSTTPIFLCHIPFLSWLNAFNQPHLPTIETLITRLIETHSHFVLRPPPITWTRPALIERSLKAGLRAAPAEFSSKAAAPPPLSPPLPYGSTPDVFSEESEHVRGIKVPVTRGRRSETCTKTATAGVG